MKIIQISTFFHPVTGGVEIQALEISRLLKAQGYEVEVFTTNSARTSENIIAKESIVDGIQVRRFRTWFSLSQFYKIAPGMLVKLLKSDFDILHVHGFRKFEVYEALIAAWVKKKKVVVTTHNPFTANIRSKKLQFFVNFHDKTIGKWFSRKINTIITLLPSETPILESEFKVPKKNITIIPNGIDNIFYTEIEVDKLKVLKELIPESHEAYSKINKWDKVVLAACRLNEVKGLQNLKMAADKQKKTLFLFLGGDDGYKADLEKLYRDNPNVVITGFYVAHSKMREAYAVADVFVLPSLHEPFGLTPVEAVASGTPVIATTVGGPKHVLDEKYAKFVDPEDLKKWNEVIKEVLEDDEQRENMVKLGKKDVNKYRWDKVMPQIVGVYKKLSK